MTEHFNWRWLGGLAGLSDPDAQIVALLANGRDIRAIGRRLNMRPDEVETRLSMLRVELGITTNAGLLGKLTELLLDELNVAQLVDRRAVRVRTSIRIDSDVLEWYKAHASGPYQPLIHRVLRAYMLCVEWLKRQRDE